MKVIYHKVHSLLSNNFLTKTPNGKFKIIECAENNIIPKVSFTG